MSKTTVTITKADLAGFGVVDGGSTPRRKSEKEAEIERLASLGLQDLSEEDMRVLRRMRDCRASVVEAEGRVTEEK